MGSSSASAAERRRLSRAALGALLMTMLLVPRAMAEASAPAGSANGASAAAANAAALPGNDLSSLLAGMRSASGVVAEFTETKELALLSSPLQATGTIYFIPPARLVRTVTSPGKSRLVVDGDKVRFEEETGHKDFDLSASPIARQLVDSFVVLFNGDEKRLKELYKTEFHADAGAWSLHLVPRHAPLDRMVASFEMSGKGPTIDRMVSTEPDGDRTTTTFGKTDAQHRFSEQEIAALFGEAASK